MNISSKLTDKGIEKILEDAVQSEEPIVMTTYTFSHEVEIFTDKVLTAFFKQIGQEYIKDYIVYSVKELIGNAKKANTKRVYFSEKGLDITNEDDYEKGMKTFKADTFSNIKHYLQLQKEKGLYIKLIMQKKDDIIHIEVRNNVKITKAELGRIQNKLLTAKEFNNMEEVVTRVLDDSEGSGLGLIILILMIRKIGLEKDSFEIKETDGETAVKILIPIAINEIEELEEIEEIEEA